jgi:thiamine-monophosphate kinase
VRESELLSHIYLRSADLSRRFPFILAGPGHDCAVIKIGAEQLLLKVDQLISGRHFTPDTPIDLIARKAIARPLSDIAAAAGTPLCALAAATLPPHYPHANELFDALFGWALHWNCPLVGGDIAASGSIGTATIRERNPGTPAAPDSDHALSLSITLLARPHPTRGPLLRSGAQPGDHLYVTGTLGGSLNNDGSGRHLTFEPRLREARFLANTLGPSLHAMMDISDGLGLDAGRLAKASGVSIEIEETNLPRSPTVTDWRRAISDGEDYELLFAAAGEVPPSCPETGTPITRIGHIHPGDRAAQLQLRSGQHVDISNQGWDPDS